MFDNQLVGGQGKGQVPANLPIGEPEDMFSSAGEQEGVPSRDGDVPSALEAGVLKPKASRLTTPPPELADTDHADFEVLEEVPAVRVQRPAGKSTQAAPIGMNDTPSTYPEYRIQEPSIFKSILLVVAVLVLVSGIGFGGFWVYKTYIAPTLNPSSEVPVTTDDSASTTGENANEVPLPEEEDGDTDPVDDAILFGNVTDSDGDGLDNLKEQEIGTDPQRFDTDGDGLSDYDEVVTWKSNPQNPDTDGDGYTDEEEIKNGYSPLGPGRIFEPPTSSPRTP